MSRAIFRSSVGEMSPVERCPPSGDLDGAHVNELGFETRFTILEEHRDDFLQIPLKLVEVGALRVGTGPARDVSHEEARFRITFDDESESAHPSSPPGRRHTIALERAMSLLASVPAQVRIPPRYLLRATISSSTSR